MAGVLFGNAVGCSTVASSLPQLWLNPHAADQIEAVESLPIPVIRVGPRGDLEHSQPRAASPQALFGLEPDWPGDEPWAP